MLDICLLGSLGGMPMPFRNLSATLLNYKGRKILIDCGEGTQVSMRMANSGFKSVDIICITHGHGDHIIGLPGLLSTIGNSGRTEPITIIGPSGIERIVRGLMVICEFLPYDVKIIQNPSTLEFKLKNEALEIIENDMGDIKIDTLCLDHSAPCIGYSFYFRRERKFDIEKAISNNVPKILWNRLRKGGDLEFEGVKYTKNMILEDENRKGIKVTLVTDSRPLENMKAFIKYSDLLICEGTYGNSDDLHKAIKNKHMTFKEAATLAKDGEVKELLLTHFSPAMENPRDFEENAKNIFKNTELGEDRLKKSINFEE